MGSDGYEQTDQRDPRVDATFVDGFDMEDEEEDRWEGPFDSVFPNRIHRTRTSRWRGR